MRRHVLTGVAFAVATIVLGSAPASACSWRGCGGYDYYAPPGYGYYPTPPVYGYAPPPAYGYYPPAPVYGYAPPPAYGYYPPAPVYSYAPPPAYGYYPPTPVNRYAPLPAYGYYPSAPVYGSGYYRSYYRALAYGYREVGWRRW